MIPAKFLGSKEDTILYPDTDGEPIAENTIQYEWITLIRGNLDILFADNPDVFIAADLFWYPVEGKPKIREAPDVMLAFGRPKGHRYSYMQWKEAGITPQVVFEIQSPSNRVQELADKFRFFERYGVEEYYLYDPDTDSLNGWLGNGGPLADIPRMNGWVSPRLGIRFDQSSGKLVLRYPDGQRFQSMLELSAKWREAEKEARKAERKARKAEKEARKAETALQQTKEALENVEQQKTAQAERAEKLAAQLRALGIDPSA